MITSKSINILKCHKVYLHAHVHLWSSSCTGQWACENHTLNATPTEKLQQHPLVFAVNCTYCKFFLWRLYLAPPSHPGQSTTSSWLERLSSKCAKLPTVAPTNNKDPTSRSFYFCLFAPHGCFSLHTSRSWWITHSPQC